MSMSFGLATTLSTSQKLTPQMQQAIKLLQLSSLELAQEVQAKLDSNPLLERIEEDEYEYEDSDDTAADALDDSLTLEMWNDNSEVSLSSDASDGNDDTFDYGTTDYATDYDDTFSDSLDKLQQANIDGSAMDNTDADNTYSSSDYQSTDSDESYGNYDIGSFSGSSAAASTDYDELDDYQGSTSASIQDYVRWQLNFKHLSDADTLIAEYLVDSMDDMGFVQLDIDELFKSFDTMASFYQWDEQIERDEIEVVLRIIQSCDPLGVGARNLSECLAIQLN
ncbi:RNA polymerase factor sigma-54, partial [Psychrobacter sp. 1U2]